jgi:SAM-dependent methyltransferase
MFKKSVRYFVNKIGRAREFQYKKVQFFAQNIKNKNILEIGSGKTLRGKYHYSSERFFDSSNTFLKTDINEDFGHKVVDVTTMTYKSKFDIILCLNVLEHVYEFQKAIDNMYSALKKGGTLIVAVPTFYPLHDEPYDYWRFSEHALRKILKNFKITKFEHKGVRQAPTTYYLEAKK